MTMEARDMMWRISLALLLACFAGCATARSAREMEAREHLASARAALRAAQADPQVAAAAPGSLADAQKTLEGADQVRDFDEMDHRAYMARRQTETAVASARLKAARQKSEALRRENEALILQLGSRARQAIDPEADRLEDAAAAEEQRQGVLGQ